MKNKNSVIIISCRFIVCRKLALNRSHTNKIMWFLLIAIVINVQISAISGSNGDRSSVYQKCLYACLQENCYEGGVAFKHSTIISQDVWCQALQWNCRDECSYHCMWGTVKRYATSGNMPKFYGKWPFVRLLGVQEPAAAFTSLLNLAANAYMFTKIRKEFPVRSMPLVLFWHVFACVCMNAWVWSTIFHTRDKPFTEFMDYACALSMVMGLFVAAVVRIFHKKRKLTAVFLIIPLFYYITHVQYLYTGRIDYDYNMLVNVIFGALGTLLWLVWSMVQYRAGRRYALGMVYFTLASAAALALELLDFPPLWGSWDAHALWHLATAPLPLLFYRFVIDDLRYLQSGQYDKLV